MASYGCEGYRFDNQLFTKKKRCIWCCTHYIDIHLGLIGSYKNPWLVLNWVQKKYLIVIFIWWSQETLDLKWLTKEKQWYGIYGLHQMECMWEIKRINESSMNGLNWMGFLRDLLKEFYCFEWDKLNGVHLVSCECYSMLSNG